MVLQIFKNKSLPVLEILKKDWGGDMGIHVYVLLIHFVIKQKLTHHCKAIILQ